MGLAVAGLAALASSVPLLLERPRDPSRPDLANGRIVELHARLDGEAPVVEDSPEAGRKQRFVSPDVRPAGRLHVGDPVLVAYARKRPEQAQIWSVSDLWRALVWRALLGGAALLAALVVATHAVAAGRAASSAAHPTRGAQHVRS